jgi:hypothetical protein
MIALATGNTWEGTVYRIFYQIDMGISISKKSLNHLRK